MPAASARFETEIEWRLVSADRAVERGEVPEVKQLLTEIEDHLDRGIGCGALADPWNILGFQGMFPLFSSREDVVPDQRIAELIEIVERPVRRLFARVGRSGRRLGPGDLSPGSRRPLSGGPSGGTSSATSTVEDLPKVFGRESWQSAVRVAADAARLA